MDSEFWKTRWQNNEIGFHQDEVNLHLEQYWDQLGVAEGGTIFVPLCGKSRDMLWLRSQGYRVIGVELSELAVEQFFSENEIAAERSSQEGFERWESDGLVLLCGDFFDLTANDLIDVAAIYDRASLVALPVEMRERYATHLKAITLDGARSLLVTLDYPQQEMSGPPFSVDDGEVRGLFADGEIEMVQEIDVLAENPQFAKRGVTSMVERLYRLS